MAEVQAESHRYCFCNGFTLSLAFLEEMLPEYVFRRDTIGGAAESGDVDERRGGHDWPQRG